MQFSFSCVVVAIFCLMAGALPGAEAGFCATNIVTSKVDICGLESPRVLLPDPSANCPKGCTAINLDGAKLTFPPVKSVTSLKPCCGKKQSQWPFQVGTQPLSRSSTGRMQKIVAAGETDTKNLTAKYSTLSVSEKNLVNAEFAKATGQNLLSARARGPLCFTDASFTWQTFCKTCFHYKGQSCGGGACYEVREGSASGGARVFNFHDFELC